MVNNKRDICLLKGEHSFSPQDTLTPGNKCTVCKIVCNLISAANAGLKRDPRRRELLEKKRYEEMDEKQLRIQIQADMAKQLDKDRMEAFAKSIEVIKEVKLKRKRTQKQINDKREQEGDVRAKEFRLTRGKSTLDDLFLIKDEVDQVVFDLGVDSSLLRFFVLSAVCGQAAFSSFGTKQNDGYANAIRDLMTRTKELMEAGGCRPTTQR